jgi:hypothetical protein
MAFSRGMAGALITHTAFDEGRRLKLANDKTAPRTPLKTLRNQFLARINHGAGGARQGGWVSEKIERFLPARGEKRRALGGRRSGGTLLGKGSAEFRQVINHLLRAGFWRDAKGLTPFSARGRYGKLRHGQHHIPARPIRHLHGEEFQSLNQARGFPRLTNQAASMGEHIGPLLNRMAHRVNRNKASEFGQKCCFCWRCRASAKPEQTQEKKAPVTGHGDFLPSKPRMK